MELPSRMSIATPGSAVPATVTLRAAVRRSAAGAVIAGSAGGVMSIVSDRPLDGLESLPAVSSSVAVTA